MRMPKSCIIALQRAIGCLLCLTDWRVLRHAPKWKSHRAITTWLEPRKGWLQLDGNTPPDSMSVQGTVECCIHRGDTQASRKKEGQ